MPAAMDTDTPNDVTLSRNTAMFRREILKIPRYKKYAKAILQFMGEKEALTPKELESRLIAHCRERIGTP